MHILDMSYMFSFMEFKSGHQDSDIQLETEWACDLGEKSTLGVWVEKCQSTKMAVTSMSKDEISQRQYANGEKIGTSNGRGISKDRSKRKSREESVAKAKVGESLQGQ